MARARINRDGDRVILKLEFHEAAALHALLVRINEETNKAVSDATLNMFGALDEVRYDLDKQGLWPSRFSSFRARLTALQDPEKGEDD